VEGVVIRLGAAFAAVSLEAQGLRVGAATLDAAAARAAADAGIAGLEFLIGVPGTVGGALTMNAGCYGGEVGDVVETVEAVSRRGETVTLSAAEMGFSYRRAAAAEGLIFTGARLRGAPGDPEGLRQRMQAISERRAASQPLKEKTGGSTFKNPLGADGAPASAWRMIDAAGCRGVERGGAMMSPQHANFMINLGEASGEALETLGEWVRARVREACGVTLEWEIRQMGRPLQ
jgi:UDP-N-acetylmuramate dehydrogenase